MNPGYDWTPLGATLLSARVGDPARELLYVSPTSAHASGKPVRGGVPIIFPQFLDLGPLSRHGFARTSTWTVLDRSATALRCQLTERDVTTIWPHRFRAEFTATLTSDSLTLAMDVENTGDEPWTFTFALHTYFRVGDIADVRLEGLSGTRREDMVTTTSSTEQRASVDIVEKVDARYRGIRGPVVLDDGTQRLEFTQSGFADLVVWSPGANDAAQLVDLPDDGYRSFLCVEPALLSPTEIPVGGRWRGVHTVRVLR